MIDANQNTWHWDSGYGAYPWRCLVMASPDESAAFRHSVDVGDYVLHVGHRVSWPRVNTFRAALLRYRFYATAWAGQGGKLIMFEGGRGWIGDGWHYPADDDHGTDGWTENSMHDLLKGTTQNRFALYVSHEDLGPPEGGRGSFGSSGDKLAEAWPLHRWITVDILVDMERGYQLFQDGVEVARRFGARPPRRSAEDCRTLGMTVRLMHGGNPHQTMPVRDYEEYFKDFEIFIYE
ncbi:MAG: hypothetical protein J6386_03090 [Candidatus Synoicihabitans palmerolidicus]|nr:hypothetical protein [Candidatus Synoicihabitans palmerolidicus]